VSDEQQFSIFGRQIPVPPVGAEAIRTVLSAWTWSMIAGTVVGGFGLQVPLALFTFGDKTRRVPGRFVRDLGVVISKANPMWDFKIHGELPAYVPSKTVVVSNHVSNSDAFLIAHLPWEMKWLGKDSLFKIPVFGWLMRLAGDVPVKRGAKDSIKDAMALCRDHLDRGMPVMIFPEGTRSKDASLLPFKDGAFRLAIETGADVLPMAVAGTKTALPKHSWRFGFSKGLVTVGEPIPTLGKTLADLEDIKADARAQIERMVAVLDEAGTSA
jgi:1-acyl-sn-glycerol-3-phosphate acyltransferase